MNIVCHGVRRQQCVSVYRIKFCQFYSNHGILYCIRLSWNIVLNFSFVRVWSQLFQIDIIHQMTLQTNLQLANFGDCYTNPPKWQSQTIHWWRIGKKKAKLCYLSIYVQIPICGGSELCGACQSSVMLPEHDSFFSIRRRYRQSNRSIQLSLTAHQTSYLSSRK